MSLKFQADRTLAQLPDETQMKRNPRLCAGTKMNRHKAV
jgi:hypothetical protein